MDIEVWVPVVTMVGVVFVVLSFFWKLHQSLVQRLEKIDERVRNLESQFARLDERTKRPVANAEAGDGTLKATWEGV